MEDFSQRRTKPQDRRQLLDALRGRGGVSRVQVRHPRPPDRARMGHPVRVINRDVTTIEREGQGTYRNGRTGDMQLNGNALRHVVRQLTLSSSGHVM